MQNKILDRYLIFHKYALQMHKYSEANSLSSQKISCAIVGARGYAGLELAKILLRHPLARLDFCLASSDFSLSKHISSPSATLVKNIPTAALFEAQTDIVFLATPAEVSLELAPKLLASGKKIIDLSGAFRLKSSDYSKWYGFEHRAQEVLTAAHYGLSPWNPPPLRTNLIANPGCYATSILLAVLPLLKYGLIDEGSIVIDAKSGTTGAGRKASEAQLFSEVDGECLPYKVGQHQHFPEIQEAVAAITGRGFDAHMSTSLLPVRRGIISAIYARLNDGATIDTVEAAYREAYGSYPLLEFALLRERSDLLSLKRVVGTAQTRITFECVGQKLYVYSCIDNLLKGAASQAVENFNRISDLPVETGLSHLEALT